MWYSWTRRILSGLPIALEMLALFFSYPAGASSITGFSPSFGQPGNVINIFGSGLSDATLVEINNNSPTPADFIVVSDSQLQMVVPLGATTGPLEVFIGSAGLTSAESFQVAPLVTNFTPQTGVSPTLVAIFGANFSASGTTVVFSGTNASVTAKYVASTEVEVAVPPGAVTGPITVITSAGTNVSTNIFTAGTLPTITGFSPAVGTNGSTVVISGGNFVPPATVKFNGTTATATITSTTEINATVPVGATTGPITVTTTNGTATSSADFTTSGGPIITNFSPTLGDSSTAVTITGFNLASATSVTFNGIAGTITGYSANGILAFPPSGSGIGPIKVVASGNSFTTSDDFTNATGPIITDFSPVLGPVGSPVTIDGINFTSGTTVKFGAVAATATLVGNIELSAIVPNGAITGPISVTGNSTTYTTGSNFTVTSSKPVITGTVPLYGVRGQSVTINGANFTNLATSAVQFGGVAASNQPPTTTTALTATVPAGAATGYITVNNVAGSGTGTALFYLQPWITGLSATSGAVNSTLLITGRSLTNASSVSVNGIDYSFTNSLTQIGAMVPTNATTGLIEITTPGGIFISTNVFAILPRIYSFSPTFGPAGTLVTINGTSLFNVTNVEFGGVSVTPTSVSTNAVQVAVPAKAASGPITVVTPYGSDASSNDFTATKSSLLLLTKSVTPFVAAVGVNVTYTLAVTNEGPSLTTSLIVTDSVPEGLTIVSSNASVGSITQNGANILWSFPTLATNASATMQLIATASAPVAITNVAYLSFAEGNLSVDNNFAYARVYFLDAAQQTLSVTVETNPNVLFLSWPVSPFSFGLQTSTNLAAPNGWQSVVSPVFITNGLNCFTNIISDPARYYRLAF
jgi:large repetitive protein